jgi:glycosyltransferase involved in cell wall biosynthesis
VPLEKVSYHYERASIFCLPSRLEPFGLAFLEAFAHGLPVVATDVGAIPDFVLDGKTGYLVKPDDVERLSEILIELLGNPEKCQTLGENGRSLILEKYNWGKVGAEIARNITATVKDNG